MIEWEKLTKEDLDKIHKIVNRAIEMMEENSVSINRMDLEMDISAAHISTPLDLDKLIAFDDFNFAHDIGGIRKHINRNNGQLTEYFLPRCAAHQ